MRGVSGTHWENGRESTWLEGPRHTFLTLQKSRGATLCASTFQWCLSRTLFFISHTFPSTSPRCPPCPAGVRCSCLLWMGLAKAISPTPKDLWQFAAIYCSARLRPMAYGLLISLGDGVFVYRCFTAHTTRVSTQRQWHSMSRMTKHQMMALLIDYFSPLFSLLESVEGKKGQMEA